MKARCNPAILAFRGALGLFPDEPRPILRFEPVEQDGRLYYRLLVDGRAGGALTDEAHALRTIDYWRSKGWTA